jgi:transposase, IS6 family
LSRVSAAAAWHQVPDRQAECRADGSVALTDRTIDAARPVRHSAGDHWFVDETYVKVAGVWRYLYRAVDQHGQVIDVYVSRRRDIGCARTFFTAALAVHGDPVEVITDRAPALANVIEELLPAAWHNTGQYQLT